MDTKWKSSKYFVFAVIAAGLAAAVIFMSLFPFFRARAQVSYSDPLISRSFVDDLFSVNYVQYKYLREKADQVQYSYSDLYLIQSADAQMEESFTDNDYTPVSRQEENIFSMQEVWLEAELSEYEQLLASYGGIMDYYVEDLDSGTVLSNSGTSLLNAVTADGQSGSGDYIYYVSLEYDNAGNVGNVSVRCQDNAKQFINTVQTAGHERQLILHEDGESNQELDSDGQLSTYRIFDDYAGEYVTYQLMLNCPQNMRVIYGLTQDQYDNLLWNHSNSSRLTDLFHAIESSYQDAGVAPVYFSLLLLCAVAGLIFRLAARQPRTAPLSHEEAETAFRTAQARGIRGLHIETAVLLAVSLASLSVSPVIRFTAEYENGLFLQSLRAGVGNNGSILFVPLDKAAMLLFLAVLFALAFLIGAGLSGIRRNNLKERSIICKYWHKVYNKIRRLCRDFYTDLIRYDIGTDANQIILKVLGVNFFILMLICCFWFAGILGLIIYTVIVYFILKRYVMGIQEKYRKLLRATSSIAQGNLDFALSEDFGVFESYKSQLRRIQVDFKRAVDEEVKSQRMKTELITNVSHDLKTPLTAIITYIDLLKEPGVTQEKKEEYLAVLQKKANRLKVLIEDLFEISKASSKTVTLQIVDVDICNLLRQAYLEQEDRISAAELDFRFRLPEKKIILSLDSQKTYRSFDNLYTNIIKYALKGTRVYVSLTEEKQNDREYVRIELKNISATELSVDPNELTERFVRGDGSRNTEGSGLGLAIAKSFAELQGGSMQIEVDGDLFKALLSFPKGDERKESGTAEHIFSASKQPEGASPEMAPSFVRTAAPFPESAAQSTAIPGTAVTTPQTASAAPPYPAPPAPWNKSGNRFYRRENTGSTSFSAEPLSPTPPSLAQQRPGGRRTKDRISELRSMLRTLWFGKRH